MCVFVCVCTIVCVFAISGAISHVTHYDTGVGVSKNMRRKTCFATLLAALGGRGRADSIGAIAWSGKAGTLTCARGYRYSGNSWLAATAQ